MSFQDLIPVTWAQPLSQYLKSPQKIELENKIKNLSTRNKKIFPEQEQWFRALEETAFGQVKVVILGQDPYHTPGRAEGLAFSVPQEFMPPPSLRNIYKELVSDLKPTLNGTQIKTYDEYVQWLDTEEKRISGSLLPWCHSGVLLLNTILTVEDSSPASHRNLGWESFTDEIIAQIQSQPRPVVFILWGKYAQSKKKLIQKKHHLILESSHPSPFSAHRGFLGSRVFSKTNQFLEESSQEKINWAEVL